MVALLSQPIDLAPPFFFFQACNSLEVSHRCHQFVVGSGEQCRDEQLTSLFLSKDHFYYKIKLVNFYTVSPYFNVREIDSPISLSTSEPFLNRRLLLSGRLYSSV